MAIKVALGFSNQLFSEGLKALFEDDKDIRIVDTFIIGNSPSPNIEEILRTNPDVIITDSGPDLTFLLRLPDILLAEDRLKILIMGDRSLSFIADKHFNDLIELGIVGVLPPSADSHLLKKALVAVSSGKLWLDRQTLMKLMTSAKSSEAVVNLGKREKEIMYHICQGFRNKEIAQVLKISEQTVKSHCNRIYKKLGISDRLQLALHYARFFNKQDMC